MLGLGRAVTCVWGNHFPVSSGTSWLSSTECTLCLEILLWAAEQELCSGQLQADVEQGGRLWRGPDSETWGSKPGDKSQAEQQLEMEMV